MCCCIKDTKQNNEYGIGRDCLCDHKEHLKLILKKGNRYLPQGLK